MEENKFILKMSADLKHYIWSSSFKTSNAFFLSYSLKRFSFRDQSLNTSLKSNNLKNLVSCYIYKWQFTQIEHIETLKYREIFMRAID